MNTSICEVFPHQSPFPVSYSSSYVRESLLLFQLRGKQSRGVDGTVQAPIPQLLALVYAFCPRAKFARYASIANFISFVKSIGASFVAVTLCHGQMRPCLHQSSSESGPVRCERLLRRSAHALDG
jgi:hypothetical protein